MATAKVILITGAARRIGAAIAEDCHRRGYQVIIHYRSSKSAAEALADKLNEKRPNSADTVAADLANYWALAPLVETAANRWQRLDAIIHNASDYFPTLVGHATNTDWERLFASNAKAPFFLSQAAIPYLQAQQGSIINIADTNGIKPLGDYSVYCMAKAALLMQTQALALELAPDIRVNAVLPGFILWPDLPDPMSTTEQQRMIAKVPLQRQGELQNITQTIDFLLTNDYLTGQLIAVDGGRVLR